MRSVEKKAFLTLGLQCFCWVGLCYCQFVVLRHDSDTTTNNNIEDDNDNASDMGVPQQLQDVRLGVRQGDLKPLIRKSRDYMATHPNALKYVELCQNAEPLCAVSLWNTTMSRSLPCPPRLWLGSFCTYVVLPHRSSLCTSKQTDLGMDRRM